MCAIALYVYYPTNENRIRRVISKSEKAIASEDIDKLMGLISYNYSDNYGNSYLKLKKTFETAFSRFDDINIERNIIKISDKDSLAEAELLIRVLASDPSASPESENARSYIIGDALDPVKVRIFLKKSPYKWLIIKAEGVFKDKKYYHAM